MYRRLIAGIVVAIGCSNHPTEPSAPVLDVVPPAPGIYQLVAINGAPLPQAFPYLPDCPAIAVRGFLELNAYGYSFVELAGAHIDRICPPETEAYDSIFGSWPAKYDFDRDSVQFHREPVGLYGFQLPNVNYRGSFDSEFIHIVVPPNPVYFSHDLVLISYDSFVATFRRH